MSEHMIIRTLNELIQSQGGNYKAVSLRAKLGETAVRDIMVGRVKNPGIHTLEKIAFAVGTSLAGVIDGQGLGSGHVDKYR